MRRIVLPFGKSNDAVRSAFREAIEATDARPLRDGVFLPRRGAVIRKLADENRLTSRMIERIIAEFLPDILHESRIITEITVGGVRMSDTDISRWKKTFKFHKLFFYKRRRRVVFKYAIRAS